MGYIQNSLWLTQSKICKSFTCADSRTHTHTHSLSGWPSWELQEVSPVRVSCPPLTSLPPFPGNSGQSTSTHIHTKQLQRNKDPQHTHVFLPVAAVLCSVPTPLHPQPFIFPLSTLAADFLLILMNHRMKKWQTKRCLFSFIFIFLLTFLASSPFFHGLEDNHWHSWHNHTKVFPHTLGSVCQAGNTSHCSHSGSCWPDILDCLPLCTQNLS